jgi:16S rRNA (uracil1498-N3)-methyltransferase
MPRPPRFFIAPEQVVDRHITISGEDVRHIATVLRMRTGDELLLCDGKGTEYQATISQVTRSEITAEVKAQVKREISLPRITLGQALPKSDKMDWIVQKATELGVATIVPLVTERTIVKIKDEEKRIARWQKIAREAAMQSNRPDIPAIARVVSFTDFLRTGSTHAHHHEQQSNDPNAACPRTSLSGEHQTLLLLPWEEGTVPLKTILRSDHGMENIIVLIGPEGGFSLPEAEMAKGKGFHLVSLGPNVLRTETAAIAVLSMVVYETSNNQVPKP